MNRKIYPEPRKKEMNFNIMKASFLTLLLFAILSDINVVWAQNSLACTKRSSPCFRKIIRCPPSCPFTKPSDPNARACFLDCNSPKCEAVCRVRKPNCDGLGAGCYDPRFVGGDGSVFYFHGRKDENFALVSDPKSNIQINARFIGLRPSGRSRDFTWMQALALLFPAANSKYTFVIEAVKSEKWDESVEHLRLTNNGEEIALAEGHLSKWENEGIRVERTGSRNSVVVFVEGIARIMVNVVPVTEEDDKVHGYGRPEDDCFAHLEVQFEFSGLSGDVEGVLGRTYRADYVSTAKNGVLMPVVGGEDRYRTSSLLAADCKLCKPIVEYAAE